MVAKVAMKKMKKAEEDYKSLLVHYKEAKCEIDVEWRTDRSLLKDKIS